ncbi:MAG: hypothetical protein AB1451_00830 [Nitrospirota bacterium]
MIIEVAAVVIAFCLVVITVVAVVALLRVNAAAEKIERLLTTLDAEIRPVTRAVSRTADYLSEALSVVRRRVHRTDDALDAVTHRLVRLSDRLFTPLEDVAALLHGVGVGLRYLLYPRRRKERDS